MASPPLNLPENLLKYAQFSSAKEFWKTLSKNPEDLASVFIAACKDVNWQEVNHPLMCRMIRAITKLFFAGLISRQKASIITELLRTDFLKKRSILFFRYSFYFNTFFHVENAVFQTNSLLYAAESDYFFRLIKEQCWDLFKEEYVLTTVSKRVFYFVNEYMHKGAVNDLWKCMQEEILEVMHQAQKWDLKNLMVLAVNELKKYFKKETIITVILTAHKEKNEPWKQGACSFFNQHYEGIKIIPKGPFDLYVELSSFSHPTIEVFSKMASEITHIKYDSKLIDYPEFSETLRTLPKLLGVDLSGSRKFPERIFRIPSTIRELDLSACEWLDNESFAKIAMHFSSLEKLIMQSNIAIDYAGWGEVSAFHYLQYLDLSRCVNLQDEDLRIIVRSCPDLKKLSIAGCKKITDAGIVDLFQWEETLNHLDLSDCENLTDQSLVEIAYKASQLIELHLSGCLNIGEKGIREILQRRKGVEKIDVRRCSLSEQFVQECRQRFPSIEIHF